MTSNLRTSFDGPAMIAALEARLRAVERSMSLGTSAVSPPLADRPLGLVAAPVKVTSNQTGISALADLSGLSVTWTAAADRYYRLSGYGIVDSNGGAGQIVMQIATSANAAVETWYHNITAADHRATCRPAVTLSGLSGSVTYKLRLSISANTVDLLASAAAPAWIEVEDVGAV